MIKKGVYAAGLSIINTNATLKVEATISHASDAIKNGLHGVFFFGSTGQSQLISTSEKKELISRIANHKLKNFFFLGTGCNSLKENIEIVKYAMEYDFRDFLIIESLTLALSSSDVNPTPPPKSTTFLAPTLDVIIIKVFVKLTFLPKESVNLPSSNICSNMLKTS